MQWKVLPALQGPWRFLPDPQHLGLRCYDSNGKPLEATAGKPSESKKPYKKIGGNKGMAFMQTMFEAYAKIQKKASKSRSARGRTMTPVTVPAVNRKLAMATRELV
jgi:hypothetical protein